MSNKKIYIGKEQYKLLKEGLLNEAEWNFHINSSNKEHDMKPYGSDSKYSMAGRETGHFGSGTYFSTYRNEEFSKKYGDLSRNLNPNFINISGKVYRVDFDLYKNLYRVNSKKQGDVLYTMCTELNHMFYRITNGTAEFVPKYASYDNSEGYQIIKRNATALGLKCPSYYELTRMAQRHKGIQSFSTLFMEWNGYNGVNVSGVDYYDNTKHGSVIYDLSKVSNDVSEVDVNIPLNFKNQYYNNTIAYDSMNDHELAALQGEYLWWQEKLNSMPMAQALRVLKNYTKGGNVLSPFRMEEMNDGLLSRYLRILYSACMSNSEVANSFGDYSDGSITLNTWFNDRGILDEIMGSDHCKYYVRLINKVGAYYWANCATNRRSMLTEMLWEFSNELSWSLSNEEELAAKKEFLNKVMQYMKRGLTDDEKEFIKEDYFDDQEGVQ